ncbi:class I SAM-dependent methyltransferase [Chitinophaga sp. CF418]|uniref:class I SAM-dependent methyltransferase n=1 Tax=Chitinophaga sp. CF418 TaxID=1855287 RepID=UPI0009181432|nr:class I SAM-dependent methyltransferase [Chitinophaga sp. CF418]SHN29888.1 Ubiquinone/menaquinone biosynthesis C-methylase UbiE [Chitinophaga sp. CF418]
MKNNYDNIARYYDFLSRMVFRTTQQDAQTALLPYIETHSTVLIAGGGTGWILEEMAKICPSDLHIYYVEISANMIALAEQRKYQHEVTFVNMAIEDFNNDLSHTFDVIITPFLFDNFSRERVTPVFLHLHNMLKPSGRWLFTDFHYQKQAPLWQRALLRSMYVFFRILCHVEADALADIEPLFKEHHYTGIFEAFYFSRFIRTAVYGKEGHVNNC